MGGVCSDLLYSFLTILSFVHVFLTFTRSNKFACEPQFTGLLNHTLSAAKEDNYIGDSVFYSTEQQQDAL